MTKNPINTDNINTDINPCVASDHRKDSGKNNPENAGREINEEISSQQDADLDKNAGKTDGGNKVSPEGTNMDEAVPDGQDGPDQEGFNPEKPDDSQAVENEMPPDGKISSSDRFSGKWIYLGLEEGYETRSGTEKLRTRNYVHKSMPMEDPAKRRKNDTRFRTTTIHVFDQRPDFEAMGMLEFPMDTFLITAAVTLTKLPSKNAHDKACSMWMSNTGRIPQLNEAGLFYQNAAPAFGNFRRFITIYEQEQFVRLCSAAVEQGFLALSHQPLMTSEDPDYIPELDWKIYGSAFQVENILKVSSTENLEPFYPVSHRTLHTKENKAYALEQRAIRLARRKEEQKQREQEERYLTRPQPKVYDSCLEKMLDWGDAKSFRQAPTPDFSSFAQPERYTTLPFSIPLKEPEISASTAGRETSESEKLQNSGSPSRNSGTSRVVFNAPSRFSREVKPVGDPELTSRYGNIGFLAIPVPTGVDLEEHLRKVLQNFSLKNTTITLPAHLAHQEILDDLVEKQARIAVETGNYHCETRLTEILEENRKVLTDFVKEVFELDLTPAETENQNDLSESEQSRSKENQFITLERVEGVSSATVDALLIPDDAGLPDPVNPFDFFGSSADEESDSISERTGNPENPPVPFPSAFVKAKPGKSRKKTGRKPGRPAAVFTNTVLPGTGTVLTSIDIHEPQTSKNYVYLGFNLNESDLTLSSRNRYNLQHSLGNNTTAAGTSEERSLNTPEFTDRAYCMNFYAKEIINYADRHESFPEEAKTPKFLYNEPLYIWSLLSDSINPGELRRTMDSLFGDLNEYRFHNNIMSVARARNLQQKRDLEKQKEDQELAEKEKDLHL